jgi:hypothetical protein
MIIDQTTDAGFAMLRVLSEKFPAIKEMAKTAELDSEEFSNLPMSAFAWPERRMFPLHNREHAVLSLAYSKTASVLPLDVRLNLDRAAEVYGVDTASFNSESLLEKEAGEEYWLLDSQRRFRVASAGDVKLAEQIVGQRYAEFSPTERSEIMLNLVKVAERYEVPLAPSTKKFAGITLTSTKLLCDWLGARKEAALKVNSPVAASYEKLAQAFTNTPDYIADKGYQVKLAAALHDLDKQAGIVNLYGKKILDPIQTVWNTDKLAAQSINIAGKMFDKNVLSSLPVTFWSDAIGPDFASEIAPGGQVDPTALEQIIETLPNDLKSSLATNLVAYSH